MKDRPPKDQVPEGVHEPPFPKEAAQFIQEVLDERPPRQVTRPCWQSGSCGRLVAKPELRKAADGRKRDARGYADGSYLTARGSMRRARMSQ